MNLNAARRLRRCVSGFFDCRMADMEGVEPSSSFSCETEGLRSACPLILFRITGWGIFPGADGRSFVNTGLTFL